MMPIYTGIRSYNVHAHNKKKKLQVLTSADKKSANNRRIKGYQQYMMNVIPQQITERKVLMKAFAANQRPVNN